MIGKIEKKREYSDNQTKRMEYAKSSNIVNNNNDDDELNHFDYSTFFSFFFIIYLHQIRFILSK